MNTGSNKAATGMSMSSEEQMEQERIIEHNQHQHHHQRQDSDDASSGHSAESDDRDDRRGLQVGEMGARIQHLPPHQESEDASGEEESDSNMQEEPQQEQRRFRSRSEVATTEHKRSKSKATSPMIMTMQHHDTNDRAGASRERVSTRSHHDNVQMEHVEASTPAHNGDARKPLPEIVVCCGTGRIGREIVRALIDTQRYKVSIITRDPTSSKANMVARSGANMIRADMRHIEELRPAFSGVYGVFSMQPTNKHELEMARNVAEAANDCRVSHFVHLSMMGAEKSAPVASVAMKARIEDEIMAQRNLRWTIVRAGQLMDDFAPGRKHGPDSDGFGGVVDADTKMPMICLADLAHCVAETFLGGYKQVRNANMSLFGGVLSMNEMAQVIKDTFGHVPQVKSPSKIRRGLLRTDQQKFYDKLSKNVPADAADQRPSSAAPAVDYRQFAQKSFPKGWKPRKRASIWSKVPIPCMKE